MNDKWPKLLITSCEELGESYWQIKSEKALHKFCLQWISSCVEQGHYEDDTFGGTFTEFIQEELQVSQEASENIAGGTNYWLSNLKDRRDMISVNQII